MKIIVKFNLQNTIYRLPRTNWQQQNYLHSIDYNISLKAITYTKKLYLSDIHYKISFESVYIFSGSCKCQYIFHLYSSFTFR